MYSNVEKFNNVDFITLKINNFEIVLCSLGASIFSIKCDDKYMTMTPEDKNDFLLDRIYYGKSIGRVCNRLPGNKIVVDNKTYEIMNNEGPNTLHGGKDGVSTKIFDYKITEQDDSAIVKFTYFSKDLESGFPGNMNIEVDYIIKENSVETYFHANCDKETMCSLTNHAYYTCGEESLDNLQLQINSTSFLHPNTADLLPVEIRKADHVMDFSSFKTITKDIDDDYLVNSKSFGYDHFFYFDSINKDIPQVQLKGKSYLVEFYTDFSGIQFYSDNYDDGVKCVNSGLKRRRGIALETSDSQKDLHYLNKGEEYSRFFKILFKNI